MGIMPTEMELTLEQTQQGVSHEVSGKHAEFDESNANVLERLYTSAGNPVNEILLKLNLPDHRSILTDSKVTTTKHGILKDGGKDGSLKLFKSTNHERYEHVGPEVTSSQDGKVNKMAKRDYAWLMISRCSRSHSKQAKEQAQDLKSMITTSNHKVMDPNSSLGKNCLGEDVIVISSDKVEGSGDWNSSEFQDTANSGQKKETKAMIFYQMETEEVSNRFVDPCFVNGLEAYDGEVNLGVEENMISNEYAVKLCLEHKVKRGNKVVKKELIVALRGEIYFVKFIINPKEDDVEPEVIFGRSFLHMTKAIIDFRAGTIIIDPDIDPFLEETKEEEKSNDDWDHLLDVNIDDIPLLVVGHLTQEEAAKEALGIRMSRKFALLEEERPIIETMAYHDKYKKLLDEVWKDKVELDRKIVKEEEKAVKRIKGGALKEKDDPEAFIFPIRLEGHVNENALADTGSDINTMPYRIYEQLGREYMNKVDRGITIINHTQAEAMGILTNVLCQVGVTTLIAKFLILDIPMDRDSPIVVGRGFLRTIGGIVNTPERLFSTFDGFCHQTFSAAR
ncbi:uncharacterized mitochondrial protein-like protein [Tanacetum coccineum]|uniref:Uncharacterized mitochondrial protein-like protein n=1 Tax=Tanacetum coccineum TaxID=301880 RepID=A0ABQ5GA34_9ASTR